MRCSLTELVPIRRKSEKPEGVWNFEMGSQGVTVASYDEEEYELLFKAGLGGRLQIEFFVVAVRGIGTHGIDRFQACAGGLKREISNRIFSASY